jgi:hypothetical protein
LWSTICFEKVWESEARIEVVAVEARNDVDVVAHQGEDEQSCWSRNGFVVIGGVAIAGVGIGEVAGK